MKIGIVASIIVLCSIAVISFAKKDTSFRESSRSADPREENISDQNDLYDVSAEMLPLKIGIINDTQVHPSRVDKNQDAPDAERYLKERYRYAIDAFVEQMKIFQPDIVVVNGDIIEGTNDDAHVGQAGLKLVKESIDRVGAPMYWTLGNHELRSVTRAQYMEALGIDYLDTFVDVKGYRLVLLDSNYLEDDTPRTPTSEYYIRGRVSARGLETLRQGLKTNKPKIVFMHHPPFVAEDGIGKRGTGLLQNATEVRSILRDEHAVAVFGGHLETKFYMEKEGVEYYSLPGTIKHSVYQGSFYEATITPEDARVTMHYKDASADEYVSKDFEIEVPNQVQGE